MKSCWIQSCARISAGAHGGREAMVCCGLNSVAGMSLSIRSSVMIEIAAEHYRPVFASFHEQHLMVGEWPAPILITRFRRPKTS